MAIAKLNRDTSDCDVVKRSIPEAYNTITQSERITPLDIQATCTEGSPWPVTYYRQRLGPDNEQRYSDTELSPSFQTYIRIKNMVIRVTAGLNSDVVDGMNTSTGTALVTGITPIVGDSFVGAILQGQYYVFNVTAVRPMGFMNTTSYEIEYELVCLADVNSARVQDLETKVYKTLVWDATLGSCGQPLVKEEIADVRKELTMYIQKLMNEYCNIFLDHDTDLFILEHDGIKLYDNHLTQFILHTWPLSHTILGRRVRGISPIVSERVYSTIWDTLLERTDHLYNVKDKLGVIASDSYDFNWSEINTRAHRVNYLVGHNDEDISYTSAIDLYWLDTSVTIIPQMEYLNVVSPMYELITSNSTYILTENYYNKTGGSVLDRMTRDYMEGNSIDEMLLHTIVNNWKEWPLINRYFQTPILILLLRYVLEDTKGQSLQGPSALC